MDVVAPSKVSLMLWASGVGMAAQQVSAFVPMLLDIFCTVSLSHVHNAALGWLFDMRVPTHTRKATHAILSTFYTTFFFVSSAACYLKVNVQSVEIVHICDGKV